MKARLMRTAIRTAMASDWFVRFAGRGRSTGADQVLDRQVAAALEYARLRRLPPLETMEPDDARAFAEANLGPTEFPPVPMAEVIDTEVGHDRIPTRIYVPHGAGKNWLVWFHGGGGVIGSIAGADPTVRYLADKTKCTIASVGYRLGPEDKHPAAIDDATEAWEALVARAPADAKIAVGGDSFGGFLTAHVDHHTRQPGQRRPDLQVMFYPLVDLTLTSPSIDRYGDGYLLTKAMMHYFRDHYLSPDDDQEAGSPWYWTDVKGSAPAIVVTAGFDPLVDEGNAWANRLAEAGVPVRHHCYEPLIHGFLSLAGVVKSAHAAVDEVCAEIVELLA